MSKRNYGIDLMKSLSMFMVVLLHVFTQGNALNSATLSINNIAAYLFVIPLYCAVNCYALISGYVLFSTKPSARKLVPLWLQALFYSVGITLFFFFFRPEYAGAKTLFYSFFPISKKQWWYLSSYFGVYLLAPLMNLAVEKAPRKTLSFSLAGLFALICIFSTLMLSDPLRAGSGYTTFWLCLMYLLGAYIKKYQCFSSKKKTPFVLTFFALIVITLLSRLALHCLSDTILAHFTKKNMLLSYTSPTIVGCALCLLAIFSNIQLRGAAQKIVSFVTPASLGVYLIHVHPLVFKHVIKNFAKDFPSEILPVFLGKAILSALVIFLVCLFVECLRIQIFKWLKLDKLCNLIYNKSKAICTQLYHKCTGE